MFLEPLEARQLLTADLTDPDGATGGESAEWTEELLAYEDYVGPTSNPSIAATYETLTDVPLDWQAAVGEVTSDSQTSPSAPDAGVDSTDELLDSGDSYSINSLTQSTSLGMLDSGASGIPASAVSTIDTLEQWNSTAAEGMDQWNVLGDGTSSIVTQLDGEISDIVEEGSGESSTPEAGTTDDWPEGSEPDGSGSDTASSSSEDGSSWESAANAALNSLAAFAVSWVMPGGGETTGAEAGGELAIVPTWSLKLLPPSAVGGESSESCDPLDPRMIDISLPGDAVFSGLSSIKITASDATWAIVDLSSATTIAEVAAAINAASIGVVAILHEDGRGFQLVDLTDGPGELQVESLDALRTAEALGMARSSGSATAETSDGEWCDGADGDGGGDGDGGDGDGGDGDGGDGDGGDGAEIDLPSVEFPVFEFPIYTTPDGGFEPVDNPRNFTRITTITSCPPDDGGAVPSTCSTPEYTSTHIVSQIWTDEDHWQFTESIFVGYDITRSSTDADGGVLTVTRSGHANVTFVAAEGMGPGGGAGVPGTGTTLDIDVSDDLTVTYDISLDESAAPCGTATSNLHVFLNVHAGANSHFGSTPTLTGRTAESNGMITGGHGFEVTGDWNVVCGEGDLAANDGWELSASGDFNANSNSNTTVSWDVTAIAAEGLPTEVSGSASISLGGGGGGSVNDELSLVAKDKDGDYDAGNGWKAGVELGWGGGASSGFGYSLGLGGDFSTNAEGDLDTNLTQDEFGINANAGGDGNDWFRANYDSKSKSVSDTTDGGWTRHSESKSTVHEDVKQESDGNSSFTFELSKPTSGDASGSVAFTFGGGNGDEWHVLDESDGEWEDHYDNGYGSTEIHQGTSKSKYKMDDVYSSSYGGDPSATLATDGSTTASGSSHADEDYTFDQVSESENKWSEETSNTYVTYSPDGSPMPTITSWDKWEEEHKFKTTDHYEAELSVDTGSESESESESDATSETLAGSDEGFTDIEWFNKTCHAWNYNGTPVGPDCNESTGTDHEDWPSYVDAVIAMMEMEAKAEDMGEGDGAGPCATCAETSGERDDLEPSDGTIERPDSSGLSFEQTLTMYTYMLLRGIVLGEHPSIVEADFMNSVNHGPEFVTGQPPAWLGGPAGTATFAQAVTAYGGPAAFSKLIGMGSGRAQALARAGNITLAEIRAAGITLPVARYWRNFYQAAADAGRGAQTALARVQLFDRIIEILGP